MTAATTASNTIMATPSKHQRDIENMKNCGSLLSPPPLKKRRPCSISSSYSNCNGSTKGLEFELLSHDIPSKIMLPQDFPEVAPSCAFDDGDDALPTLSLKRLTTKKPTPGAALPRHFVAELLLDTANSLVEEEGEEKKDDDDEVMHLDDFAAMLDSCSRSLSSAFLDSFQDE